MTFLLVLFGLFLLISAGALFIGGLQSRSQPLFIGALVASVAGILAIIVGFSLVSVEPNERLVIFNRISGDLGEPREPGLTLVNPLTTSYRIYDVSRQTYTMSSLTQEGDLIGDDAVEARTDGGQVVYVDLTVIYSIDPTKINLIHTNWPDDRYRVELVRPLLRSVVRDAVSQFSVETVYQERDTIDRTVTESIVPAMEAEGFIVQDILVRNIKFTDEYAASIEAAQIAEVNIREQQFRVQEAEQRADQVEVEARGRAEARKVEAAAEAEALRLIAEVLTDNPALLEYQYVQNLSDQVQVLALPANSPFIFDLDSFVGNTPAPPLNLGGEDDGE